MFFNPNMGRPIDFMPYSKRRYDERQVKGLTPIEAEAFIQRGMATASWAELQDLLERLHEER